MHSLASRRLMPALAAMLLLLALPILQAAAQSSPEQAARARRLDELFAALKTAKEMDEGNAIVTEIWDTWMQSGSPEIDGSMKEATMLMAYGQHAIALALLDGIVAKLPDWAEGWNKRATLLYVMGEHDRSLADIDRTLALEPRHFGAMAGIGLILMDKGQTREALAAFRRAHAINPFLKESYGIMPMLEKELGEKPL